jgi:TPR repeat protein
MYATKGMSVSELVGCLIRKTGLLGRYQKGLSHLQLQEYEKAYRTWLKLAENGDAQAQFDLGVMFHNGLGLEKDNERALYWFDKAASQNDADAENYLGAIY